MVRLLDRPKGRAERLTSARVDVPRFEVKARRRRSASRLRWLVLAGVLVLVLVAGLAGGLALRSKAQALQAAIVAELSAGQQDLSDGKALLSRASSERSLPIAAQAASRFTSGRSHFLNAERIVVDSRLLRLATHLPFAGSAVQSKVDAVRNVSRMGDALADAGAEAVAIDSLLIKPAGSVKGPSALIAVLHRVTPSIAPLRADLVRADTAAGLVDPTVLPAQQRATFVRTRATIRKTVAAVEEFKRFAPVLVDILGGNGRRTYLVEQVNPGELRSGGGFLGTLSVLEIDGGNLRLRFSGDVTQFESLRRPLIGAPGYVAPPHALNFFYSGKTWWLEDSNFSPNFPTNGGTAEFFSKKDQHLTPQGVFALDYYAVASLLEVTGPISVPQYGVTFTSGNFVQTVSQQDLLQGPNHKPILAAAAGPLMDRIASLSPDRWLALIQSMNSSATSRHLQAYFDSPAAEQEMRSFGWSGDLNPASATDFLLETEDNFGGTKANYFVTRHFSVDLIRQGSLLHHTVVLTVQDKPPALQVPFGYHYHFYLRYYVPQDATSLSLRPNPGTFRTKIPAWDTNPDVPVGYKLADGWVYIDVNPGRTNQAQLTLEYDTPWTADAAGAHVLYFQKQAGTDGTQIDLQWEASGQTAKAHTDLNQDRALILTAKGIEVLPGQVATAQLPGLSL